MEYNYSAYVYAVTSGHTCNCEHCPQCSVSPASSNDSYDSGLYTPTGTPQYFPISLDEIPLDATPAHLPWDIQVEQLNGWNTVAPHNSTPVRDADLNCFDYEAPKLPKMLPAPPELSEIGLSWFENGQFSDPGLSTSTSNAILPAPVINPTYNHASYSSQGVEAANYYNVTLSQSQPNFTNVQFPRPQISMPMSNRAFAQPINTLPYPNASFGYPAVEEHTLYDSVPLQPNFAMPPMPPSYSAMQQPPLHIEQYIPPRPSAQSLQPSSGPWGAAGPSRGEKRKRTTDTEDDTQECTDDEFNLLNQKKIGNINNRLSPLETGMTIPRSGYVEQPKITRTKMGASPSKSSKGKATASSATRKPRSRGPKKTKVASTQEADDTPRENEPGTSQDDGRRTKRARTSNSDAPAASSSRSHMTSSSEGGRLVEATKVPELVKVTSMFQHVPNSAAKSDPFIYMVLAEQQNVEAGGVEPREQMSGMADAVMCKWM